MEPDRDRLAEWEAVPRYLLVAYGVLCGCVIVATLVAAGWLLAYQPGLGLLVGAVVLPAAVLGAGWTAYPLLSALVRRWPCLAAPRRGGRDGTA